jgi:molecular chaperone HtpG
MEKNEEKLKFSAEISKVLQLMIHSLYTNKDIFLRELISNASDACDKLRYEALTTSDSGVGEFAIAITIDKNARALTISDNGVGMNRDDLIAHLGTIAKSGTQEFISKLSGDGKKANTNIKDWPLIGQFGVGFYASFMVADKVTVISCRAGSNESWQWESEGTGEFTVTPSDKTVRGTEITLHLKAGEDDYLDKFRLRHIVQTYSDHISFPIIITNEEGKSETVNTASALWTRSKSDITDEQYNEFYHHVAHAPDEPWLTLHNKAEGKLEYTNLLFIPSAKPFDLFHPDRKRRVKLYVKRVFITEENIDIVPQYLRFLRGIIDSQDLPLNISRETLQNNPMLTKIKDSVVKRVLSELKKKGENDNEHYHTFWKNFGAVVKEGLCEATTPREQILEVCRFQSTAITDALTSLDSYISRMKEGQDQIYYLTGDRIENLRNSPQLEGFIKRGIEVLLLSDHVDDFWVNVVFDYKGKKFKSVTRADIDLSDDKKADDTIEEKKTDDEAIQALCARIKDILGDTVKDVRTTHKLTNSAVCLAVEEGAMDFRLERFLIEQKQLSTVSAKILEINPDSSIIKLLVSKLETPESSGDIENATWLLFDQARILEGEEITDTAAFTRRLQGFVEKSLAA